MMVSSALCFQGRLYGIWKISCPHWQGHSSHLTLRILYMAPCPLFVCARVLEILENNWSECQYENGEWYCISSMNICNLKPVTSWMSRSNITCIVCIHHWEQHSGVMMFPISVGHFMLMHVCMYLFLIVCRLWRTHRLVVCHVRGDDIHEEKQRYQPQFSDEAILSQLVMMWTREYAGAGVAGTDISSSKSSEMLGWYFFEIYSAGIVVIVLVACSISR